jgi:hypothetical protein
MYNWGSTSSWTISTYRYGSLIDSVDINFDQADWIPFIATQSNGLTPAYVLNIDEIRII